MTMHIGHRNSNLFIRLSGDFTHVSACAAVDTIAEQYTGRGNIFVNVVKIGKVQPTAPKEFRKCLASSSLPLQKVYFIGKKGFEIGSGDFRVIIPPKENVPANAAAVPEKASRPSSTFVDAKAEI